MKTNEKQFPLKMIDISALEGLSRRADLPKDVSNVIEKVRHLRVGIADLQGNLKPRQVLLADITNEQARIRSNMSSLDRQSDLYRQYVGKLTAQESKLDKVLQEIDEMRVKQVEMERDLAKYFPSTNSERANPGSNVNPFE
jgi:chromosome segregation ATPase